MLVLRPAARDADAAFTWLMIYFRGMDDKQAGGFETGSGLTEKELRWSQWWVDHREQVRKTGLGLFIACDALFLSYGLWGFADWLFLGGVREEAAIRQMTGPEYAKFGGVGLQEVQVGAPIVLPGGTGKIDVLTPIENANDRFWAELSYRFVIGGVEQPLRLAFVLPKQAKYLTELGAPSDSGAGVELKIERRLWHRADAKGVDPAVFAETRLNIQAENPVFHPADPLATTPASSASFTLANHTAFGYYDIGLLVLLYRGDAIVGVDRVDVASLAAGERKPMELFWYQLLPQVTKVEVVPDINIYDPNAYKKPGA